ncbi:acyl-CoA dehydrogenase family protein [Pseudonocardia ailaonensis]|uniref:Acyl-CoA dehydrogenase family protein n=1 Tax=Pseudonocardia ailaonensis TaxID=367279 RepID=A0ABN2N3L7_9PSEU
MTVTLEETERAEVREELQLSVRRLLHRWAGRTDVNALLRTGDAAEAGLPHDPALWQDMADLGLLALLVPDDDGEPPATAAEVAVVLTELGRGLVPSPYLSSALLVPSAILRGGRREVAERYLPGLTTGAVLGAVAFGDAGRPLPTTVRREGDTLVVGGTVDFVLDLGSASVCLVAGVLDGAGVVFAVDLPADGARVEVRRMHDVTRSVGRLVLDDVRVDASAVVADGVDADEVVSLVRELGAIGLAADSLGVAESAMEAAVAYAGQRRQFGRAIGSFQAVKHLCVDMFVSVEAGREALKIAMGAADRGSGAADLAHAASVAKAQLGEPAVAVARSCIQVHGGIGFTWEAVPHRYLKRLLLNDALFGDTRWHRRRVARAALGAVPGGDAAGDPRSSSMVADGVGGSPR